MSGSIKEIIASGVTITDSYVASNAVRVSDNAQHAFDVLYTPGETGNILDFYIETSSDDERVADADAKWVQEMEWDGVGTKTSTVIGYQYTAVGTTQILLHVELAVQCKRLRMKFKETGDGSPTYGTITIRHLSRPT